ncbi:hypothetical protein LTR85_011598 [Meristemomyces frigidus]|nr:hypothetical protein LTR85_011598 [Meristemomyces frigidus]
MSDPLSIEIVQEASNQRRRQFIPLHQRRLEAEAKAAASSMPTADSHHAGYFSNVTSPAAVEEEYLYVRHPSTDEYALDGASDAGADRTLLPDQKYVRFEMTEVDTRDFEAARTPEERAASADRFARQMSRGLCIMAVVVLGTLMVTAGLYLAITDPAQLSAMWS